MAAKVPLHIFCLTYHCPAILLLSLPLFCYFLCIILPVPPCLRTSFFLLHPIHSYKVVMEVYVQRTHGTYIEQKGNELIWQFRSVKCSSREVACTVLARTPQLLMFV